MKWKADFIWRKYFKRRSVAKFKTRMVQIWSTLEEITFAYHSGIWGLNISGFAEKDYDWRWSDLLALIMIEIWSSWLIRFSDHVHPLCFSCISVLLKFHELFCFRNFDYMAKLYFWKMGKSVYIALLCLGQPIID